MLLTEIQYGYITFTFTLIYVHKHTLKNRCHVGKRIKEPSYIVLKDEVTESFMTNSLTAPQEKIYYMPSALIITALLSSRLIQGNFVTCI